MFRLIPSAVYCADCLTGDCLTGFRPRFRLTVFLYIVIGFLASLFIIESGVSPLWGQAPSAFPPPEGQVYQEYDIRPYTSGITNTSRPEQAIMDAILRETGYQTWHGAMPSVLAVGSETVRVWHTPDVQDEVAHIIRRYLYSGPSVQTFQCRIMSVSHPDWRVPATNLLRAVSIQTPGASAWVVEPQDVPPLMRILQDRGDFQQLNTPFVTVHNGQPTTVNMTHPRPYVRGVAATGNQWSGFQPVEGTVDEGYKLEFVPLVSADGSKVDAQVELVINKIEKIFDISQPIYTNQPGAARTLKTQTPRIDQFRFAERFVWPADKGLLISVGMTPRAIPGKPAIAPGIPLLGAERVDTLLFLMRMPNPR